MTKNSQFLWFLRKCTQKCEFLSKYSQKLWFLPKWKEFVIRYQLTEFYSIFTTFDKWWLEIEKMMTLPFSNGKAERVNRDIKQAKNAAFEYET